MVKYLFEKNLISEILSYVLRLEIKILQKISNFDWF